MNDELTITITPPTVTPPPTLQAALATQLWGLAEDSSSARTMREVQILSRSADSNISIFTNVSTTREYHRLLRKIKAILETVAET